MTTVVRDTLMVLVLASGICSPATAGVAIRAMSRHYRVGTRAIRDAPADVLDAINEHWPWVGSWWDSDTPATFARREASRQWILQMKSTHPSTR